MCFCDLCGTLNSIMAGGDVKGPPGVGHVTRPPSLMGKGGLSTPHWVPLFWSLEGILAWSLCPTAELVVCRKVRMVAIK